MSSTSNPWGWPYRRSNRLRADQLNYERMLHFDHQLGGLDKAGSTAPSCKGVSAGRSDSRHFYEREVQMQVAVQAVEDCHQSCTTWVPPCVWSLFRSFADAAQDQTQGGRCRSWFAGAFFLVRRMTQNHHHPISRTGACAPPCWQLTALSNFYVTCFWPTKQKHIDQWQDSDTERLYNGTHANSCSSLLHGGTL